MKDVSDSNHSIYEVFIDLNELNDDEKTIRLETKIQIFSVIG